MFFNLGFILVSFSKKLEKTEFSFLIPKYISLNLSEILSAILKPKRPLGYFLNNFYCESELSLTLKLISK